MIVPAAAALVQATRWLPTSLASRDVLARVSDVARTLPLAFSDFAIECRLGSSARLDLLAAVVASDGGHRRLIEATPFATVGWQRVFDFCEKWANHDTILRAVPFLWLEFDIEEGDPRFPDPFPFPCVHPGAAGVRAAPYDRDLAQRLVTAGLECLRGCALPARVLGGIQRCVELLPRGGALLHVAPLSARGLDGARLVFDLPVSQLPAYLGRVGLPGSLEQVRGVLFSMYAPHEHVAFHLDVGAEIGPVLGLEVVKLDGNWHDPLDRLVEWDACLPAKRDALLAWPGRDWVLLSSHRSHCHLERVMLLKLVHHSGMPLSAKAYLGFRCRFGFAAPALSATEERRSPG